jgi:hypothetical protein
MQGVQALSPARKKGRDSVCTLVLQVLIPAQRERDYSEHKDINMYCAGLQGTYQSANYKMN